MAIEPKKDLNISRTIDMLNSNNKIMQMVNQHNDSSSKSKPKIPKKNNETLINLGDLDKFKIQFDKQPKDEGLLHLAIKSGHLKIVEFLL